MNDLSPTLYREAFSSPWRRAVPWLRALAAALVVAGLLDIVFDTAEMAQTLGPGLLFLAFWVGMSAVYLRAKKPNAEVVVTESGACTIEEGREISIDPAEITDISVANAAIGYHSTFLVADARDPGRRIACNVRPLHLDFFPIKPIPGVLIRLRSEEVAVGMLSQKPRPTFVPSKDPVALEAAMRRMWVGRAKQ